MSAIRSFIAISLSNEVQNKIFEATEKMKCKETASIRWVRPQNIHLTLKFLGDVSSANLKYLTDILDAQSLKFRPFEFSISGLGAFPNMRHPRVIWLGIQGPPELIKLQNRIDAETRRLGYPSEKRPFSPHLTLGRISRNASPLDVRSIVSVLDKCEISKIATIKVTKVHLYRSDLKPGGAVYTSLYTAPLKLNNHR